MAYNGKQYAVTTSAVNLTSILGLTTVTRLLPIQVDIKNATGNTGKVYLGKSNVTNVPANAFAQIDAGVAWSYVPADGQRHFSTDDLYVVGTVGAENVFITVID